MPVLLRGWNVVVQSTHTHTYTSPSNFYVGESYVGSVAFLHLSISSSRQRLRASYTIQPYEFLSLIVVLIGN